MSDDDHLEQDLYEEYDEEEEEEEEEEQVIREMGMHKKMQRIQQVLLEQLQGNDERVSLALREKEEGLRRLKNDREETGVSLYGFQQQLAKLQMQLESTHFKFNKMNEERYQTEENVDEMKEKYQQRTVQIRDDKQQLRENQSELDSLNATLKQVAAYNEEMKSEIEVTRRAAYKTEENISNLEKGKKKQDLYIDSLNEEIKSLKTQIKINVKQISAQVEETKAAQETLTEAAKEMENISFEKKQLLQQWKSSLIGMQRRDEALQETHNAITNAKESVISIRSEISGYKQAIGKAQELNETLTGTSDRIETEIKYCEDQLSVMSQEKDRLSQRYSMLQKSMQQTDVQSENVAAETKSVETELSQTQQSIESIRRERHKIETQISLEKNEQTTVNEASHNLAKEAAKIQQSVHEAEVTMANMKNELARVKIDNLNTKAHNVQLRESLQKLVINLKEKDTKIEKTQLEIRQRNDEIEKKMLRVDRLNKKYEQLTCNKEDANTGPLEATIKHIKKESAEYQVLNAEKQRLWLNSQTGLVTTTAETEVIVTENQELKSNISILEQKRLRLLNSIDQIKKEAKGLKTDVNGMHKDMTKLNSLIAKNSTLQEKLSNANYGMEQEFVEELKELEQASIQSEIKLSGIKAEKQQMLDQIMEVEHQAMMWEKKIQLEKETQAALDPEVGQQEAREMEREIHRMEIRYETLKREQERLVHEMERALNKHQSIAIRGRGQRDSESTAASMTKKVSSLQNSIRKSKQSIGKYESAIKDKMEKIEFVSVELEKVTSECNQREELTKQTQQEINNTLYEKQRYVDAVSRVEKLSKRLDDLVKGRIALIDPSQVPMVEAEYHNSMDKIRVVREVIETLSGKHGHLSEVLGRVALLSEDL